MTAVDIGRLLEESEALRQGHFSLSSGRHAPDYVQCALLLESPQRAHQVGQALSKLLADFEPTTVVSPALGGVIIGHEVASALGLPFRFTERSGGKMVLRRGFRLEPRARAVVVEDVVTTGTSTREAIAVVEALGVPVVAVGAIVDRSGSSVDFERPFRPLARLELETYEPASCPLCARGAPLSRPGSRPGAEAAQPSASR